MAGGPVPAVVAPCVWSGLSEHHMGFGGTITLDFGAFLAVLRCVVRSIRRHGFQKVFLLNGHGGNTLALRTVADELAFDLGVPVATGTYWLMAEAEMAPLLERQPGVRHACEAETSMILAICPDLVDRDAMRRADSGRELPAGAAYRWRALSEATGNGVIGFPSAASAEKGERLLDAAAARLAATLAEPALWTPLAERRSTVAG
jgi:creatinine amidohydrolase